MVKAQTFFHDGNVVARFNVKNANVVEDDNGNIKLSKRLSKGKKGRAKIDGLSALNNAMRVWMDHDPPKISVYETRGLSA